MKIHETKDYTRFKLTADNREVIERRVSKLLPSMRQYGWLESHPMLVRKSGDKYEILDGQGRFHAAKQLGLSVRFVVTEKDISIPQINEGQSPWSLRDYVGSYAQQGNPGYHFLLKFAERHKLPIGQAAQILRGGVALSGNANSALRSGSFEPTNVEFAEHVAAIVSALAKANSCGRTANCVNAVSRVLNVKPLNIQQLLERIEKNPELVTPKTTAEGYVEMLELIYNFMSKRQRLPLAFLTKETMANRRVTFGGRHKKEAA
jgi:hypothetical protein